MAKPNIAVLWFPGNNCEVETLEAVKAAGMKGRITRWNAGESLNEFDGYIIPGGWSYEDRIRAGVVASKEPVISTIKAQAEKGKPVLGICNGAQILIESGMVPGLRGRVEFALAPNRNPFVSGYYNSWVNVKHVQKEKRTAFTHLTGKSEIFPMPVAHGEGCFVTKDKKMLNELERNSQVIFQYSTEQGKIEDKFPTNPNGSAKCIAALSNKEGNVMAIMPHPERAIWKRQIQNEIKKDVKTGNIKFFESIKKHLE